MGEKTHIDPHVSGLFVDYVRLRVAGHGLQALLSLCRVVCDGDEEGRGQQDQLEFSLTAVQKHCPATRGNRETKKRYCCVKTGVRNEDNRNKIAPNIRQVSMKDVKILKRR